MEKEKTAINFTKAIKIAEKFTGEEVNGPIYEIGYRGGHINATDGYIGISLYVGGDNGPDKHLDFEKILNIEFKETAELHLRSLEYRITKLKKLVNPKNMAIS